MTDAGDHPRSADGHRSQGLWLAWVGGFLLLVMIALGVLWWKLPQWAPMWVAQHSPWPDLALRALRHDRSESLRDVVEARLWDWGRRIGPALRRQFAQGDDGQRMAIFHFAYQLAHELGSKRVVPSRPGLTDADEQALREDLYRLVAAELADGSEFTMEVAARIAPELGDGRVVMDLCEILRGQRPPINGTRYETVVDALDVLADSRAVPFLIPLLPIRHKVHPGVSEALIRCLDDSSVVHVLAATHHSHPVIRMWAAQQFARYRSSPDLTGRLLELIADPERDVCLAAIHAAAEAPLVAAAPILLRVAEHDSDPQARLAAVEGLGRLSYAPAGPYLRTLVQTPQEPLRGAAIIALGSLHIADDFTLLFSLLHHDDDDIARKARIALDQLPLTPEQRRQVDVAWKMSVDAATP